MSYMDAVEQIKARNFSSVYYLYGTENYMIEEVKQALFKYALEEEDRQTNVSQHDLEETSIQEVVADCETLPFLGERKLVIANNPSFLKAKPPASDINHHLDRLLQYIDEPAPFSILLIIAPYEKRDDRKKVNKQLKQKAHAIACEPLKEWNMDEMVYRIARQHHVTVSEDVVQYIVSELGTNLMAIQSEITKMALYVGEGNQIKREDAEQLLSHYEHSSGLKLMDTIMNRDLAKAMEISKDLEKMNEDPIALLALIASQFRTLMHVKMLKQKGYNQNQMAQQLGIHPYVAKLSLGRSSKFSHEELQQALSLIADTDAKIKQGKLEKSFALELLLYQLINRKLKNVT
ncbi:DNA polymerase III subunit delta [Gracilibacillus halophilus YIM-C55.5]|uniref:DNA polymerase III subunit delta n=1 Tax=Gracilibacillus halophilus YIM-C55.5 TaxID=1308866 RepID=N4WB74_9BACI|nr:DNA polymerase III subunit delta [Gracilibacillus halophilus]ENH97528.1 DNA polymerase III subunit delta [Gracilibacillus halophilus YIM-C55.5]